MGAACENATLFLAYNKCKEGIYLLRSDENRKDKEFNMKETALAAAGAGCIASFIL